MPIYEFFCPDNRKVYSFLARTLAYSDKTPLCPDNPKFKMERMLSQFAFTGRAKEKQELPADLQNLDEARMARVMAEMERDFDALGDREPDPRHLASMIRKITAATGETCPKEMDEVIRRMEMGEDPEKIEADYGDEMPQWDPLTGEGVEKKDDEEVGPGLKAALWALRRRTRRDPNLYEMSEYVVEKKPVAKKPAKAKRR